MLTLVDQYNKTYFHSNNKKPIHAAYSTLTEKNETNARASKFKVNDRVIITKYKNIFSIFTLKIGQEKYLSLILFWQLILGLKKIKCLNGQEIIVSFYEKELLLSKL